MINKPLPIILQMELQALRLAGVDIGNIDHLIVVSYALQLSLLNEFVRKDPNRFVLFSKAPPPSFSEENQALVDRMAYHIVVMRRSQFKE